MEISRSDSRSIQEDERARILSRFSVTRHDLVGVGTEAEVYDLDKSRVLKLYPDVSRLQHLTLLQDFYSSLDRSHLHLALPHIYEISSEGNLLAVVEHKISGVPLSDLLPKLKGQDLKNAKRSYVESVDCLKEVRLKKSFNRHMLFDEAGISLIEDWNEFLQEILKSKLIKVEQHLKGDVSKFDRKINTLLSILSQPFRGSTTLIHGDFFPGNLLMTSAQSPVGIIDFGMFTMFGDHLFDIATAWAFFDMYSPDRIKVRSEFLKEVQEVVGEENTGILYRYLLIYSILSCDLYITDESPQENGHYGWAVEILNDTQYWGDIS